MFSSFQHPCPSSPEAPPSGKADLVSVLCRPGLGAEDLLLGEAWLGLRLEPSGERLLQSNTLHPFLGLGLSGDALPGGWAVPSPPSSLGRSRTIWLIKAVLTLAGPNLRLVAGP